MSDLIFVFGSNLAGRHGKGAAKYALDNHGAIYGRGKGLQGSSYAIPTKNENIQTLPLDEIERHIVDFLEFAKQNSHKSFALTPVGTGLAGLDKKDIWSILKNHKLPLNVYLTSSWLND